MKPYAEVIGDPVAQSKSPAIHRHWLERSGLDGDYRAQRVQPNTLAEYLANRRADPAWRGCNVTMPLKRAVMPFLDRVSDEAAAIGAVNTVVREGDGLTGYNTDAAGFLEPLIPLLERDHLFRMARVLGAGGAARAVVHALSRTGFVVVLAARDPGKAHPVLDECAAGVDHHVAPLDHFAQPTDFAFDDRTGLFDLVVNTTPLGMAGHGALRFDLSHAPPGALFYDVVTDPPETDLLRRSRDAGFETIGGLAMLIGQAAAAFERFFGQPPDRSDDAALRRALGG